MAHRIREACPKSKPKIRKRTTQTPTRLSSPRRKTPATRAAQNTRYEANTPYEADKNNREKNQKTKTQPGCRRRLRQRAAPGAARRLRTARFRPSPTGTRAPAGGRPACRSPTRCCGTCSGWVDGSSQRVALYGSLGLFMALYGSSCHDFISIGRIPIDDMHTYTHTHTHTHTHSHVRRYQWKCRRRALLTPSSEPAATSTRAE